MHQASSTKRQQHSVNCCSEVSNSSSTPRLSEVDQSFEFTNVTKFKDAELQQLTQDGGPKVDRKGGWSSVPRSSSSISSEPFTWPGRMLGAELVDQHAVRL